MLAAPADQLPGTFPSIRLFHPGVRRIVEVRPTQTDEVSAFDVDQLARLRRYARRALDAIAPCSVIAERTFDIARRRFVVLAAPAHGRGSPRNSDLIRLAIASGAGLRFRAIGRLAVIVLELPHASEKEP